MPRAWLTRAGAHGERENAAIKEGLLVVGWSEIDSDLGDCPDRTALLARLEATYPDINPNVIANWAGQLWRFLHEMSVGDLAVIPLKSGPVAIGRITGPYRFRADQPPGFQHVRDVEWLRTDLERDRIRPDLRASLGSLLTVCELSRFDAAARIAALAEEGSDPGSSEDSAMIRELTDVADLAEKVGGGEPVRLTIRQFLAVWGEGRRSPSLIERIRKDLGEFGLSTTPPFTEHALDTTIEVVQIGEVDDTDHRVRADEDVERVDPDTAPPLTFLVGNIPSARGGLVTVAPDDPLTKATTLLVDGNFSQLAVVSGNHCHGGVSWVSIGRATLSGSPRMVADAVDTEARVARLDDPLLSWVDDIERTGYVFVSGPDGVLKGIVTTADLTRRFGQDLRPFLLLEEIERRLRRRIGEVFTSNELLQYAKNVSPAKIAAQSLEMQPDELTFKQYDNLLSDPGRWARMGWRVDHETFRVRLDQVRVFRNTVMHFHNDPIGNDDPELKAIVGLVNLLRIADPRP